MSLLNTSSLYRAHKAWDQTDSQQESTKWIGNVSRRERDWDVWGGTEPTLHFLELAWENLEGPLTIPAFIFQKHWGGIRRNIRPCISHMQETSSSASWRWFISRELFQLSMLLLLYRKVTDCWPQGSQQWASHHIVSGGCNTCHHPLWRIGSPGSQEPHPALTNRLCDCLLFDTLAPPNSIKQQCAASQRRCTSTNSCLLSSMERNGFIYQGTASMSSMFFPPFAILLGPHIISYP